MNLDNLSIKQLKELKTCVNAEMFGSIEEAIIQRREKLIEDIRKSFQAGKPDYSGNSLVELYEGEEIVPDDIITDYPACANQWSVVGNSPIKKEDIKRLATEEKVLEDLFRVSKKINVPLAKRIMGKAINYTKHIPNEYSNYGKSIIDVMSFEQFRSAYMTNYDVIAKYNEETKFERAYNFFMLESFNQPVSEEYLKSMDKFMNDEKTKKGLDMYCLRIMRDRVEHYITNRGLDFEMKTDAQKDIFKKFLFENTYIDESRIPEEFKTKEIADKLILEEGKSIYKYNFFNKYLEEEHYLKQLSSISGNKSSGIASYFLSGIPTEKLTDKIIIATFEETANNLKSVKNLDLKSKSNIQAIMIYELLSKIPGKLYTEELTDSLSEIIKDATIGRNFIVGGDPYVINNYDHIITEKTHFNIKGKTYEQFNEYILRKTKSVAVNLSSSIRDDAMKNYYSQNKSERNSEVEINEATISALGSYKNFITRAWAYSALKEGEYSVEYMENAFEYMFMCDKVFEIDSEAGHFDFKPIIPNTDYKCVDFNKVENDQRNSKYAYLDCKLMEIAEKEIEKNKVTEEETQLGELDYIEDSKDEFVVTISDEKFQKISKGIVFEK